MINIRLAKETDAEKLYEMCILFNNSVTANTIQGVVNYLQKKDVIVCMAETESSAIGFITGCIENNMSFGSPIGTISELFVREEFRRIGVAKQLFESIEQAFLKKGVNRFRVFTTMDNTNAVKFYNNQGYNQFDTAMFRKDIIREET